MTRSKIALIAAVAMMAFASQAYARTVSRSNAADNPYYAPYASSYSGGSFAVGGFH
jgi:hypothetical protein